MGEQCTDCGAGLFELEALGRKPILFIDHIDNNNGNNSLSNLQFLCRGCNTKKNWTRDNNLDPTTRNAPLELQLSKTNKKKARKYIAGRMDSENYALVYEDLIDDLTEYLDNSQQANKNYIKAFCSKKHGLYTLEDRNGTIYLVPKNDDELDIVINSKIVE
jgi:hypothetical protein